MTPAPLAEALAPLERALLDHHRGRGAAAPLVLRFDDGTVLEVPPAWFFRAGDDLEPLDRAALSAARGRVLDVGAGAGVHALPLQDRGHPVTALEPLPGAARILRERGVRDVRERRFLEETGPDRWETILLLMNGSGLAGTLAGLPPLLAHARHLLAPGGRILIDSSDPGPEAPGDGRHPGELQIQLEYRGRKGAPFPHLYVGPATLERVAASVGLRMEVVAEGEDGRYLAGCWP